MSAAGYFVNSGLHTALRSLGEFSVTLRWPTRLSGRRLASVVVFAVLVFVPAPVARAGVPVLVLEGSGWGHGVGMAQDGAYWMGRAGTDTAGILRQFYPGTRPARTGGSVRVGVATIPSGEAVLGFPGGGQVRDDATGLKAPPLQVPPGGQVVVGYDGSRYRAELLPGDTSPGPVQELGVTRSTVSGPGTTSITAFPSTTPGPPPSSTIHALRAVPLRGATVVLGATGRRYRGMIEATGLPGAAGLRLVNELDVESYLRGMGEVRDPSWPPASLRAQAIAARTYALRAMATSGEICADERCQVYLGQQAEYPAMDEAVLRTAGQVLTFAGQLASTFYSANGGGVSASPEEGFGPTAVRSPTAFPYLRAARYPTGSANPWSVTIALSQVAARLRYPGALSSVTVGGFQVLVNGETLNEHAWRRKGARQLFKMLLSRPGRRMSRDEVVDVLWPESEPESTDTNLRSTLFAARLETGDGASAPPPVALQVPPEETAMAPVVAIGAFQGNVASVGAGGDALSPAGPARQAASHGREPTWPEVLMAAALALCLALRRYGRAGRTGRRLRRAQHGLRQFKPLRFREHHRVNPGDRLSDEEIVGQIEVRRH